MSRLHWTTILYMHLVMHVVRIQSLQYFSVAHQARATLTGVLRAGHKKVVATRQDVKSEQQRQHGRGFHQARDASVLSVSMWTCFLQQASGI